MTTAFRESGGLLEVDAVFLGFELFCGLLALLLFALAVFLFFGLGEGFRCC